LNRYRFTGITKDCQFYTVLCAT